MTAINRFDRVLLQVAPTWALQRIKARALAETLKRHFEAALPGRRTENWRRASTDVNAANGPAIHLLRVHARDLVRNNPLAKRGKQIIANNTVGWGIMPKPMNAGPRALKRARQLWNGWAGTTECDYNRQLDFYGLQRLLMDTIAESGEVIVRRYRRRASAGLTIPLQLQVLEPDYIDTTRDGLRTQDGNKIVQGVEYNGDGQRVAYWLFEQHPGSTMRMFSHIFPQSQRVPAEDILHIYRIDRPGQVRGVSWYAPIIVRLKDFDEFEDATLLRQKIAACFAAFIIDQDGTNLAVGERSVQHPEIETIEPGMITRLPMGKGIEFASPPATPAGGYSEDVRHGIASGLGVTYEDLTGDYSMVNFSSARMSRISHWANVHDWRWNMLIPMFCDRAWGWAMEMAAIAGDLAETPTAGWTPPPMPMIEPDKEGLAYQRLVRGGTMTHDDMVREQGGDPDVHWQEYKDGLEKLDALGIVLDSDARRTTQAGNPIPAVKSSAAGSGSGGKQPAPNA